MASWTVLVANRGEIAVRIMRTLRAMGIRSVAVYSDADAGAHHVEEADEAIRIGPAPVARSYLHVDHVLAAATAMGADALHPGYGFLAENAGFAEACAASGIRFIGPAPSAIATMGDKIRARQAVAGVGVAVVPGRDAPGLSDAEIGDAALELGLPVLLKPSAGGGGKGMRIVTRASELRVEIESARREAGRSFGDDTLFVERFVERPRHIEVQVVADDYGNVVHLGERECSLQRRHQKIIEEAPSPFVTPEMRADLGARAIAVAKSCGYTNVGTVEFIVAHDCPEERYFIEMNTRLQVEHAVTEHVYGVDLVEAQVRIARGEPLPWDQADLVSSGHAVEARIYAEDPDQGFVPSGGTIRCLREPTGEGIRVDSGLRDGTVVGSEYDPMLAKVVASGRHRVEALDRLDRALADTAVLGVTTNIAFLRALVSRDDVRSGELDTGLIERMDDLAVGDSTPDDVLVVACLLGLRSDVTPDVWSRRSGWRLGGATWIDTKIEAPGRGSVLVRARRGARTWAVSVAEAGPVEAALRVDGARALLFSGTRVNAYDVAVDGRTTWLGRSGHAWELTFPDPTETARAAERSAGRGPITSPMPGVVVLVLVAEGDRVTGGQPLAVVEAMKTEHTLSATYDGLVEAVHVKAGQRVARHEPVVTVAPTEVGDEP